jgi:hypothetical protein
MATVNRANQTRDGHGRYRRAIDRVERDVRAAILHAQGKTYDEIAAECGYSDKDTVFRSPRRRYLPSGRRVALWPVITDPPPVVSHTGKIVTDKDGRPRVLRRAISAIFSCPCEC